MKPICKIFAATAVLVTSASAADQQPAAPLSTLVAKQTEVIPLLADDSRTIQFVLEVAAACQQPTDTLALIATVADTSVSIGKSDAAVEEMSVMTLEVPIRQLSGMQRPILCARLPASTSTAPKVLIEDAFSAQVVGICMAPDGSEQQLSTNSPLDVYIECGVATDPGAGQEN